MKRALQVILGISLFGMAFSGFLSYREFFGHAPAGTCAEVGPAGTIFNQPPCVYGLLMYFAIVLTATTGLGKPGDKPEHPVGRHAPAR